MFASHMFLDFQNIPRKQVVRRLGDPSQLVTSRLVRKYLTSRCMRYDVAAQTHKTR